MLHAARPSRFALMLLAGIGWAVAVPATAQAELLRATYLFDGNLDALEPGAPSLVGVDPLGLNRFEFATIYGLSRSVYRWDGDALPFTKQAGLILNTTGLIPRNNYSVEMVFEFHEGLDSWRRILDAHNRTTDQGLYVNFDNRLALFPEGAGTTFFTNSTFHHVVLTNGPGGMVSGYLDGRLEFTFQSDVMNINNPGNLLNLFLDDPVAEGEYSDGRIGLLRVYEGTLTGGQVAELARDPYANVVPEPTALSLLAVGTVGLAGYGWRRRSRTIS